jgi:hypothetical protein
MTVGAKALVLTAELDAAQDSTKSLTSMKLMGINEEAEIRKEIVSQERVRSIRRNILEKIPLVVWKKARNGEIRLIRLVIRNEGRKSTWLEWVSKMNYMKKFEIDEETVVSSSTRLEQTSSNNSAAKTSGKGSGTNIEALRLRNRKRCLDLQFREKVEADAFLLVLQNYVPSISIIL